MTGPWGLARLGQPSDRGGVPGSRLRRRRREREAGIVVLARETKDGKRTRQWPRTSSKGTTYGCESVGNRSRKARTGGVSSPRPPPPEPLGPLFRPGSVPVQLKGNARTYWTHTIRVGEYLI